MLELNPTFNTDLTSESCHFINVTGYLTPRSLAFSNTLETMFITALCFFPYETSMAQEQESL